MEVIKKSNVTATIVLDSGAELSVDTSLYSTSGEEIVTLKSFPDENEFIGTGDNDAQILIINRKINRDSISFPNLDILEGDDSSGDKLWDELILLPEYQRKQLAIKLINSTLNKLAQV